MRKQMMWSLVAAASVWFVPSAETAQISTKNPSSAQSSTATRTTAAPTLPSFDGSTDDVNKNDPTAAMREAQRTRSFASERQKKIVQDTEKLLALATELKAQMEKTTKNEMSLDVIKKAEEIERLAHDVKLRMKG